MYMYRNTPEHISKWAVENKVTMCRSLDLDKRNKAIIDLCNAGNLTHREIAQIFDITFNRVGQINNNHKKGKSRL